MGDQVAPRLVSFTPVSDVSVGAGRFITIFLARRFIAVPHHSDNMKPSLILVVYTRFGYVYLHNQEFSTLGHYPSPEYILSYNCHRINWGWMYARMQPVED